jgi:8-amino-7-oxononanoate synthase
MRQPEHELAELKQASLLRNLPAQDRTLLNFSSNDYLGLASHPRIKKSYQDAIGKYGAGSTASRLICGSMPPHRELECLIANAKGTEAALTFSTGYATSVGTITSVVKKGDTVILDKLCHASLIDGARMSGATLRVFPHNHLDKLESLIVSSTQKSAPDARVLVITESIFSMDGDAAPLKEIATLTQKHGSLLMVDEAHALGVIGPTGMGLAEQLGIQDQIDFHMGTLGKAAGVAGGYLAASQAWIDLLVNRARSFIYSTAPPPAQAAAAAEAIRLIRDEAGHALRKRLWQNIETFRNAVSLPHTCASAIIPWMVGESDDALALSAQLREKGILVPAIRYPTVPPRTARLRITLSAAHDTESIHQLATTIVNATNAM